ncbi:type 1 fimbrial protein [Pseudomonas protegens]|nr:type 1 fimbrial protein [Pseudomonas protegens]
MHGRLLFLLCCISGGAWADCTGGDTEKYLDFDMGTQYVPRDAPIGSVIGTANASFTYKHSSEIECRHGDLWETRLNAWPRVTGITLPPFTGLDLSKATILKTNVPGVGVVISAPGRSMTHWINVSGAHPLVPFKLSNTQALRIVDPVETRFTLIKVSNDIPMGSSQVSNSQSAVAFWSGNRRFHSVFLLATVVRSECSLAGGANTYLEVPMGEVMRRQFNGKDSHMDSKDVVIPLTNCTAGTYPTDQGWNYYQNANAHLRLEGVQGSAILDAHRGILGLTSDSTAKGVAVQVLRKDGVTPLTLGQEVSMARLSGSQMNIELKARYIQTSDSAAGPEPGKANARAAFTLTYK